MESKKIDYNGDYTTLELEKIIAQLELCIDVHKNAIKLAERSRDGM